MVSVRISIGRRRVEMVVSGVFVVSALHQRLWEDAIPLYKYVRARAGVSPVDLSSKSGEDLEFRDKKLYLCTRKSGGRALHKASIETRWLTEVSLKIWRNENFDLPLHSQKKRTTQRRRWL